MAKGRMLSKKANKAQFAKTAGRTRRVNTKISMMRGGPRL